MDADKKLTKKEAKYNTDESHNQLVVQVSEEEAETAFSTDESVSTTIVQPSNSGDQGLLGSDSDSETEILKMKTAFDREVMVNTIKNRRLLCEDSTEILKNLHSQKNFHNLGVTEGSQDDGPKCTKQLKKARNIRFRPEDSEIKINEFHFQELPSDQYKPTSSSTHTSLRNNNNNSDQSKETDEFELFFDGNDEDDVEDDHDKVSRRTPTRSDSITSKMELLQFFEIPSITDISDDSEDT